MTAAVTAPPFNPTRHGCKHKGPERRPLHRMQGPVGRHHLHQVLMLEGVVQMEAAVVAGGQEQIILRGECKRGGYAYSSSQSVML